MWLSDKVLQTSLSAWQMIINENKFSLSIVYITESRKHLVGKKYNKIHANVRFFIHINKPMKILHN